MLHLLVTANHAGQPEGINLLTVHWPRSSIDVVAQRLATTEQSVSISWTRSVFPGTDITGTTFVYTSSVSFARSSEGRFQPSKTFL